MSEMVERVARALCERAGVSPDDIGGGTWDGGSYPKGTPAWRSWCDDARAAISAMREPTKDMIFAGNDESGWGRDIQVWQAMVDASLEDK